MHQLASSALEDGQVVAGQPDRGGGDVLGQVRRVAGARDRQHVRAVLKRPCQPDLGGGRRMSARDVEQLDWLSVGRAKMTARASDREERHEGNPLLAAGRDERLRASVGQAVAVLDADHRRDRARLRKVGELDAGDAQVPDQAGVAELSQRADVLGYRRHGRHAPQVHHVQVVTAELAQVLLYLPRS